MDEYCRVIEVERLLRDELLDELFPELLEPLPTQTKNRITPMNSTNPNILFCFLVGSPILEVHPSIPETPRR